MIQKSTLSKTAENKSTSSPWPDSARRKMSFTSDIACTTDAGHYLVGFCLMLVNKLKAGSRRHDTKREHKPPVSSQSELGAYNVGKLCAHGNGNSS
jgi:hypothetical protein